MGIMLVLNNQFDIDNAAIVKNFDRIMNAVFKLLPLREEKQDWNNSLDNTILELASIADVITDDYELFQVIYKLNALKRLESNDDFPIYRKYIFEILGSMGKIKKCLMQ